MNIAIDWTRLDVSALCQSAAKMAGHALLTEGLQLVDFPRLEEESCQPEGLVAVQWGASFEARRSGTGQVAHWMHLQASASLWLICQRCMEPVLQQVQSDRWFRFVEDEATALLEDDESDEDLLVFEPKLNLLVLVEDELILSMPLIPMHDVCPDPVTFAAVDPGFERALAERERPFASLAGAKGRNRS